MLLTLLQFWYIFIQFVFLNIKFLKNPYNNSILILNIIYLYKTILCLFLIIKSLKKS